MSDFEDRKKETLKRHGIDKLPLSKRARAININQFAYGSSESDGDNSIEIKRPLKAEIKIPSLFDGED